MKKLLLLAPLLLAFLPTLARAQTNAAIVYVTSAPSGACQTRTNVRLQVPSGDIYTCHSNVWRKTASGASGGTCPAGSANVIQKTDATNCVASGITDDGTTVSTTELISTTKTVSSGSAGGVSGKYTFAGGTSGSAAITVPAVAGTPSDISLPIATGAASSVLQSDGGTPQLTSWATNVTRTVANGTSALGTGAISSATCATVVTTAATGTATTDNIMADFNADPTAVTGYTPSTNGMLTIIKYPTSNNVNFKVCNNTAASITPGAITLNWRVTR